MAIRFLKKSLKTITNTSCSNEFLNEKEGCLPDDLREALNLNDIRTEEEVPVGVLLPEEVMLELDKHSNEDH